MSPEFILASASPARRRLLQSVGIDPIVCVSNFDESQITLTEPIALVETLARCKAETVVTAIEKGETDLDRDIDGVILGCDSVLTIAGEIHGKPKDAAEAFSRWQLMRGNSGTLYTGHALIDRVQQRTIVQCGITEVYFGNVSDAQIRAYIATGEPLACAGCFALEGKGAALVDKIDGCHSNVIGLSLPLLRKMFAELGYDLGTFW
jgi:septum formation protein